mmetsp:Transcript_7398/g.16720  ORF Transcript_7398/g.16720 Transcript_7398/m.16720 type:complete len:485 (+) Transcript_7398:122-1576(+)|eukprot:CAMPEP_0206468840 /NCGR_PEP_ID=MMETSP0324_2-20121206/29887_1 /ASSEMBLY_ACC=CAM_ASM_000836 /TAXON_ID=2866 /ORGANISM="Crypthecodinium cohnii, Strain Seligo" /LENGTH=484 /DNA_ID=CAMNT_0053942411 /DNA_START=37 /DNA_END=1491 /DNA_ORIENTATION=-
MPEDRAQLWESISWQPKDLQVGDRVGLLVNGHGEAWVVQNDRRVCKPPCRIPPDRPLYPLIDLLGNTTGISLVLGAQPPVTFHRALSGGYITLSSDGLVATHQDPTGQELKGVAFLSGPAPLFEEGAYFEVTVEEVCEGNPDGLTIGVTVQKPSLDDPEPATADDVPDSWSIGFDGQAKVEGEMIGVNWRPCDLKVGDRIGLFVDFQTQSTWVVENGECAAEIPGSNPPMDRPLYGFVDLLGNTTSISLVESAVPPGCSASMRLAGKTAFQTRGGGFLNTIMTMIVDATQRSGSVLSGFDRARTSELVELSADGLSAVHKDTDEEMKGVLFGDAPLPRFDDDAQYFEVRVDSVTTGFMDGLVIGVTSELPDESKNISCADEVPGSWTFGYDGAYSHVPGEHEEEVEDHKELRFRKNDSLYRVSRFSESAFRISLRSDDGCDEEDEEDDLEEEGNAAGDSSTAAAASSPAPAAAADEDEEEDEQF